MVTEISNNIITKVNIFNFKCFKGQFSIELNKDVNIIVGNNAAGKSTILEAIHLVLTGMFQGRYIRNDLSQYLFNNEVVQAYLKGIKLKAPIEPPSVLIELFIESDSGELDGNGNSENVDAAGLWLKICFDEKYKDEYEELIKREEINTIPIEYYEVKWESFARQSITPRTIPIKSAFIDSSGSKNANGSDLYVSRIVKDTLETKEIIDVSQAHRKLRDHFMVDEAIININTKIGKSANIVDKKIQLAVDLSSKNSWESTLITYIDDTPFHFAGKGEQSVIKTKLALSHKKAVSANLLILEEPENHLSHTSLNQLLYDIQERNSDKQIILSTHSSFVANKLGLDKLILLNEGATTRINDLDVSTEEFFSKIAGYDTLRLVLCKKAILVEGDSDELVVQKAYMQANNGRLPIQDGIEVISVGTSFLRFLDIAQRLNKPVVVVTDNDGDPAAVKKKYAAFFEDKGIENISICFDDVVDVGSLKIGKSDYNYNTLEPKMLKKNGLEVMNKILGTKYTNEDDMRVHMKAYKTDSALKIFNTTEDISFPDYIVNAISNG